MLDMKGLDCILHFLLRVKYSLVSRSGPRTSATVLTTSWLLTVIRDSSAVFLQQRAGCLATHHGCALPTELCWQPTILQFGDCVDDDTTKFGV